MFDIKSHLEWLAANQKRFHETCMEAGTDRDFKTWSDQVLSECIDYRIETFYFADWVPGWKIDNCALMCCPGCDELIRRCGDSCHCVADPVRGEFLGRPYWYYQKGRAYITRCIPIGLK